MSHRRFALRTNLIIAAIVIVASLAAPWVFSRINSSQSAAAGPGAISRTTLTPLNAATPAATAVPSVAPSPTRQAGAAPSAAKTATSRPTNAVVVQATATASPTAPPAATATPTDTPIPTRPATAAPTATVVPPPSPVPTETPRPTARATARPRTPRPTATPTEAPIVISPPALSNPANGARVTGVVRFSWLPTGPMPIGSGYEVVWWNSDESPGLARGFAPVTTTTFIDVNLDALFQGGQFKGSQLFWTVLVVRRSPFLRWMEPPQGEAGTFFYDAPRGGGSQPQPPPSNPTPPPPKG